MKFRSVEEGEELARRALLSAKPNWHNIPRHKQIRIMRAGCQGQLPTATLQRVLREMLDERKKNG